ncbi:MAG: TolC family protein [Chitinophagaceae bacterium]
MKEIETHLKLKPLAFTIMVIITLVFYGTAHAQRLYTLRQVLDSVSKRNPGLRQYGLLSKSANSMAESAKAWEAPLVGVGMSEYPYPFSNQMITPNNQAGPRKMLIIRLQQMFPNFSQQNKEEDYYRSFSKQNQDDQATLKNQLFGQAKLAYYNDWIAENKLIVIDHQAKQLELLIQITEGRLSYNKSNLPNIYNARAKLSDLKSMKINMTSIIDQATEEMNLLMDRSPKAFFLIDTTKNLEQTQFNILQVDSSFLQTNRTDILHTTDEIHSLHLEQEVSSALSKPRLGLTLDNMRMNTGMYMYSVMAMMTIPIAPWSSIGYKSKVQSTDYQIQSMKKMRDYQVLQAMVHIRKDWLTLQSAKKDLEIFKTEVIPAYAKTYQANLNAFSENTGDIYQTLMAWDDLTMKKLEYFDKLSDLLKIQVKLETEMQLH